ncbi:MAG: HepT-like ribonuclease domain-containing protein [Bacteroidales bacterium]
MSPIKREFLLYLEDMYESMRRIEEYLGDIDLNEFKMTYIVVDAVTRNFEIIGEASKKIPTDIQYTGEIP